MRLRLAFVALATLAVAGPAYAIIGRPLTPFSVAGVARRTTRRAVVGGAAVGAAYGGYGYGGYGYGGYAVPPPVVQPVPVPVPVQPVAPAYYW